MFTIRDIIDLAIQIEENGERVYRKAAQEVSQPSIAAVLAELADEEVKHARWLSDLKGKATKTIENIEVQETGKRILQGILGDQSFSLKDVDFSSLKGVEDLLSVAIEFEQDTVLFYEMMRSFIDDKETLDHLDAIIEEENHHVLLLKESLLRLDHSSVLAQTSQ